MATARQTSCPSALQSPRFREDVDMLPDGMVDLIFDAMVLYGKIHGRDDVMLDFASSLTWDGDCNTNFVHSSPHAFKWNGGSDLRSNAHLLV